MPPGQDGQDCLSDDFVLADDHASHGRFQRSGVVNKRVYGAGINGVGRRLCHVAPPESAGDSRKILPDVALHRRRQRDAIQGSAGGARVSSYHAMIWNQLARLSAITQADLATVWAGTDLSRNEDPRVRAVERPALVAFSRCAGAASPLSLVWCARWRARLSAPSTVRSRQALPVLQHGRPCFPERCPGRAFRVAALCPARLRCRRLAVRRRSSILICLAWIPVQPADRILQAA